MNVKAIEVIIDAYAAIDVTLDEIGREAYGFKADGDKRIIAIARAELAALKDTVLAAQREAEKATIGRCEYAAMASLVGEGKAALEAIEAVNRAVDAIDALPSAYGGESP